VPATSLFLEQLTKIQTEAILKQENAADLGSCKLFFLEKRDGNPRPYESFSRPSERIHDSTIDLILSWNEMNPGISANVQSFLAQDMWAQVNNSRSPEITEQSLHRIEQY